MKVVTEELVPCRVCAESTPMTGTKLCNPCWEMQKGLARAAQLVARGSYTTLIVIVGWLGTTLRGEAPL